MYANAPQFIDHNSSGKALFFTFHVFAEDCKTAQLIVCVTRPVSLKYFKQLKFTLTPFFPFCTTVLFYLKYKRLGDRYTCYDGAFM